MTFILPEDPTLFRHSFDNACKRILGSEMDPTFYALFAQLIYDLREHPLLNDFILDLEAQSGEKKQEFNTASLEALEDNWKKLWKYHHHNLKQRKQLVRIKRMITAPDEISSTPLYYRILFSMRGFYCQSPFCNFISKALGFFRTSQSERHFATVRINHYYPPEKKYFAQRKAFACKLKKKNKLQNLRKKIFNPGSEKEMKPFRFFAECVSSGLFSTKIEEIERKYSIPGSNSAEKRRSMQNMAETNPVFCWERVRFLNQCYNFNDSVSQLKPLKGRWALIHKAAWQFALERCDIEVLLVAKMAFRQKLSTNSSSIDSFLACEHQFHRRDYENYLQALQHHIHNQLFKIESSILKKEENSLLVLPGTQRENFVIDLATKYWKRHPSAKHDDVFQDYCLGCPSVKLLSRSRWDQIVRDRHLDPRPRDAKKRGLGKKTLQN